MNDIKTKPDGPGGRHYPGQDVFRTIAPEEVEWHEFPGFPAAARLSILIGNPKESSPYLIRVHLPAGTKMMPHVHPEDRIYTVISGVFYIGLGKDFDDAKLVAHAPGSIIVLPGGQPHFHCAKSGDYITQVYAIGPLGLHYVDPVDDPRARSVKAPP